MFQFSCRFAFLINFSSFKPDTDNNTDLDAVSSKHANFDEVQFLKHIPKFTVFGTHNLHTFKHNTLINKLLLKQFYLFNIRPKLHHCYWQKLCVTLPVNMAPFSKEDKILIKCLYEYKNYNAQQFITEFPDKGWTKNCINRLLVKLRKFRTVDRRPGSGRWRSARTIFGMQFQRQ